MSTTTVYPNGDGTKGSWTDSGGGTSNLYTNVDEGTGSPNDSDLIKCSATNNAIFLLLGDMPGDFDTMDSAIVVKVRARRDSSKGDIRNLGPVQIFQSDESTALTDSIDPNPTASFADYELTLNVTGATDKSSWDGARLKLTTDGGTVGGVEVSAIQVDVTYTPSGAYTLTADAGSFSLSGQAASVVSSRKLTAAAATFALTGIAASFTRKLIAGTATFSLTGVAANLERGKKLTAEKGEFTLTGIAATPLATRTMSALTSVFQLDGEPATFITGLYELDAETAEFALSGIAATPTYHRVTTAATGEFTLTGIDAPSNYKIPSETATFALTANPALMRTGIGFKAATGSFALTGVAAGMRATRRVTAAGGSFTITARPVAFPPRHRVLLGLPGSFAITANAVEDIGQIVANPAVFALSGKAVGMTYTPLGSRSNGPFRSRILQSLTISLKG